MKMNGLPIALLTFLCSYFSSANAAAAAAALRRRELQGKPECQNTAEFNAGYGGCSTYVQNKKNYLFCDSDFDQTLQLSPWRACPGCNRCKVTSSSDDSPQTSPQPTSRPTVSSQASSSPTISPDPTPEPTVSPTDPIPPKSSPSDLLGIVNEERNKVGLAPYKGHPGIDRMAQKYAKVMCEDQCYSHFCRGTNLFERYEAQEGLPFAMELGENLLWKYASPEATVKGWMWSQGHREVLLDPKFNTAGVGYNECDGANYWVFVGVETY